MAMERQSRFHPLRDGHYAAIDGSHKLVLARATGQASLYDLAADPAEQQDIAAKSPAITKRLRAKLDAQLERAEQNRKQRFGVR